MFFYTLVFANNGEDPVPNVSLTDAMPKGVTFVSATPAPTTSASPNYTWNLGTIAPGTMVVITNWAKGTAVGTHFNNVTARSGSTVIGSANQAVEVAYRSLLQKEKTVTPTATAAGNTVDYTITVSNDGTGGNGVPLIVRDHLPPGFTFQSLLAAKLNGAAIASPTISLNAADPKLPVFTVSQSIQAGKVLEITFRALVGADVEPDTYFNGVELLYEGKRQPPIPEAPVTIAGGKIGDTIFLDWNGDGVQDPGEKGIAGIPVMLYDADGSTLLATTITDANGNYYFAGLTEGTYVVKVNDGTPPTGYTLTADPDTVRDNMHTVDLGTDEQYLTADFGYQPYGTATIGDKVFEDIGKDGVFTPGTDSGIPYVTVWLYADTNGNGVIDDTDIQIGVTQSDGNGDYLFTGLAPGFDYLVMVDQFDPDIQSYFDTKYNDSVLYAPSTPEVSASPNLTGDDLDNDFGFWQVIPGSIGDQAFIDANGDNLYDEGETLLAGVTVTLLRNGEVVATTVTGPDGTYLFEDLGPGDYVVTVDGSSPGVPAGHSSAIGQHLVTLESGQEYLEADFPFVPLISKAVDKDFAPVGSDLLFTINANYPGSQPLSDVFVIDPLPAGVTFDSATAGGTYGPYVSKPGSISVNAVPALGMAVYNNNNDTFRYRTYNADDGFSAELNAVNLGTRIQMMAGASSPTTAERVITFMNDKRDVYAAIWNGTAWVPVPTPPATTDKGRMTASALTANSHQYWGSAVAYEQSSGHLMLIWNDDASTADGTDDELRYVTRESGIWGTVTSLPVANQPQNLRLTAKPNSDELALVFSTAAGADYVMLWSGMSWGLPLTLDTTGGALTSVNVAYESQSGRAMVVYGKPSATSPNLFYRLWDGSSWSAEASVAPPVGVTTQPQWVSIASDPFSNRIAAGVVSSGGRTWLAVWDGSDWVNVEEATATSLTTSAQNVAVAFETFSGDVLAAYGVNSAPTGQVRYRTWSWDPVAETGAWSAEESGPTATSGNPNVITLSGSPTTDRIMMAINTSGNRANYVAWDGSSWDETVLDAGNTQVSTQQPMIYLWNRASGEMSSTVSLTASPVTAAIGEPITVKLSLASTHTVAEVTPDLRLINGTAEITTTESFPITITGGVTREITYTVTPSSAGEIRFRAIATSAGGYEFGNTDSNTILVSEDGSTDVVIWELGSSRPRADGLSALNKSIYAFRGDDKKFWRYNVAANTWTALKSTSDAIKEGGALVYANDAIYALRGDKTDFWRYSIATDSWTKQAALPGKNVKAGGALSTDGTYIYAFQGDGKKTFYRYDADDNTWTTLADAPGGVKWGGALTFVASGNVTRTRAQAEPALATGVSQVLLRMRVSSSNVVDNIIPDAPTYTAIGGATASFSAARLISADDNIGGSDDPVIYEWTATVTPGTVPGEITFHVGSSAGASARANSVLVAPALTYSATINDPAPGVIRNTAIINEVGGGTINNVPSGTTETFTSGSIGDFVWHDANGDGVQDEGEAGLAGVRVEVYAADGVTLLGYDITDAAGAYRVGGLGAGDYVVRIDPTTYPADYAPTTAGTLNVTLADSQQYDDADFGLRPAPVGGIGSIGDRIWLDADNNGVQGENEPGLEGITVFLQREISGIWTTVATQTTGTNGLYSFTGLPDGEYRVSVDTNSLVASPYGGNYALGAAMAPTYDLDGTTTPNCAVVTLNETQRDYDTLDFGYNWSGSIGDYVWWDTNLDGVQDLNEEPAVGAYVMVFFDYDGNGILDANLGDYQIASAITDANGNYLVENLPPGPYLVKVYEDSLTVDGVRDVVPTTAEVIYHELGAGEQYLDADFGFFRGAAISGNVFWDDNRNAWFEDMEIGLTNVTVTLTGTDMSGNLVVKTTTTGPDGSFHFLAPEGDYTLTYDMDTVLDKYPSLGDKTTPDSFSFHAYPGEDGNRTSYDFGVDGSGLIGDTVFADVNGIPGQQAGEAGLAGVTVRLYANPDGSQELNGDETLLEVTITDEQGQYFFPGLNDGSYLVEVVTSTLPSGYETTPTTDPTGALDSQGSAVITGGNHVLTVDFGYPLESVSHSISGTIYDDNGEGDGTAKNGTQDGEEPGLDSVRLSVQVGTNGVYQTFIIYTDANGNYELHGIPQGSDVIITVDEETLPNAAYVQTGDPDGGELSSIWTITDIQDDHDELDFGYNAEYGAISGTVVDGDGNGRADEGEEGLANVEITLTWAGPDGIFGTDDDTTETTYTDGNGYYEFTDLIPGDYRVTETDPEGYVSLADADGGNPNLIDVPDLQPGQTVTGRDFEDTLPDRYLGDYVWYDLNGDGIQDAGEDGIANVIVKLVDGENNVVATTRTDSEGNYLFKNVDPGTYTVQVDTNSMHSALAANPTFDDDGVGTPHESVVAVEAGDTYLKSDFGYNWAPVENTADGTGTGAIGDRIWFDINGDGEQDDGEPGIRGVLVELYDDENNLITTTVTDGNGNYWFGGLEDGNYTVVVDTTTLPNGGDNMTNTGDPDGGGDSESLVTITGGETNLDQDFGYKVADDYANKISGTIWEDRNADGTLNAGETTNGVPGVTVVLRDKDGNVVAKTTTDADGDYEFDGLPDGDYTIHVTDEDGKVRGWWKTYGDDPGSDNNSQPDGYAVTVVGGQTNTTGDFGFYYAPASLGDRVWEDFDGNGIQDKDQYGNYIEVGIVGVEVQLKITYPGDIVVTVVTVTDAKGNYRFDNLLLDDDHNGQGEGQPVYEVSVKDIGGIWRPTTTKAGAGDVDSDLHGGAEATVVQGEYDDTYDFGYYYPARIHGYGYADRDGTLMRDPGDPGTSNMLIKLYLDGVEVAVTNAAADGFYSFDNLKPGAYEIRFYGDNDYLTERPQEGTSEAENIERNRAEKSDKDYAVIYHTVYSGDYYREGSFNQPLNAGYRGTGPMSSGIDLRAYAAADGVYVEFIAYDVEADDWVSLYLVDSNGVVIWFDDVFIEAGEQQFVRFKVPGLEAGQEYDFAVRDEVGKVWWVYDVKVGTLKTEMISMTNSGVVLSFTSLPERTYTVQWSARLGTFWQPVVTIKAIDTKTTVVVQPPDKSSPTGFFRVVLQE